MKKSCTLLLAALVATKGYSANAQMTEPQFEQAAAEEFAKSHRGYEDAEIPDNVPKEFQANYDFPSQKPSITGRPWLSIDPYKDWKAYLSAALIDAYTQCGDPSIDWDGSKCGWYHAPWFHDAREYINGLTRERSTRIAEAHPNQNRRFANYAVGLYNDLGAYSFGRIWKDPARPKTMNFAFEEGTVSVKLLFSTATELDIPYLRYAKQWPALLNGEIETVRIFQLDVAIKDKRAGHNGWFFGTYFYNGSIELPRCSSDGCEEARWIERMVPIGIQWGNDPELTRSKYEAGERPHESILDPEVAEMFRLIRLISGHPPYLGRYHRMNGPIDNPKSACMACHMRAVDFGRPGRVPFTAAWDASEELEERFFRNLSPIEPFVAGTQSLDYSLQASIGINNFRTWVDSLDLTEEIERQTRDVPKLPDDAPIMDVKGLMTIQSIPSTGAEASVIPLPAEGIEMPRSFQSRFE